MGHRRRGLWAKPGAPRLVGRPGGAIRARHPQRRHPDLSRRTAGPGAHGERLYDWTVLTLDTAAKTDGLPAGWGHWLLVRRQIDPPPGKDPELAFYRCAGPTTTPVPELIRVAGARWAIEECFQTAKNQAGLDHYQVRGYRAWYAHITLAMLAAAYLAATRAQEAKKGDPETVAAS